MISSVLDCYGGFDYGKANNTHAARSAQRVYASLKPGQIGTDRATRRLAIQAAQDQLAVLRESKATLASSLRQLGITVKG